MRCEQSHGHPSSFSKFSSSSNSLTKASDSSWASPVAEVLTGRWAHCSRASPCPFTGALCTATQTSSPDQPAFAPRPLLHAARSRPRAPDVSDVWPALPSKWPWPTGFPVQINVSFQRPISLVTWQPRQLLVPTLGSFLGEIWAPNSQGKERWERQATPKWYLVVLTSKVTYRTGLCWAPQEESISAPACQNLYSLYRGLNRFQSCTVQVVSRHFTFSRLHPWKMAIALGLVGRMYIKNKGGAEAPPIARVHLEGQPVVMSSQWPPPTVASGTKELLWWVKTWSETWVLIWYDCVCTGQTESVNPAILCWGQEWQGEGEPLRALL